MKDRTKALAAALTCLIALGLAEATQPPEPPAAPEAPRTDEKPKKARLGEKAPEFTLMDTEGRERRLADCAGKLVVIEWVNPKCPFVRQNYRAGTMQETYKKARERDKSLVWLAINSTPDAMTPQLNENWRAINGIEYPILLDTDGEVARLYDARRTPHMFVIDKEGVLRYHGAIDNRMPGVDLKDGVINYVLQALRQIADGETVDPDHVAPVGGTLMHGGGEPLP